MRRASTTLATRGPRVAGHRGGGQQPLPRPDARRPHTSYFLRDARAYDTLLQMGRWFGYRDGYADLCRLWLTDEARGWYEHVTEATGELKRDFARMKRRQATPREFGLRVRTHPDTLLITARNKMAAAWTSSVSETSR